jgi:hypothetical protein
MGPPYMWSVGDRNVVTRNMTVVCRVLFLAIFRLSMFMSRLQATATDSTITSAYRRSERENPDVGSAKYASEPQFLRVA